MFGYQMNEDGTYTDPATGAIYDRNGVKIYEPANIGDTGEPDADTGQDEIDRITREDEAERQRIADEDEAERIRRILEDEDLSESEG
jgi:hypothetical protein